MAYPTQNSPNVQILGLPMNQYTLNSTTGLGAGVAGSVVPMNVFVNDVRTCTAQGNYWSVFMKEGESSPICFVKRPGDKGQQVTIRVQGTLGGVGERGDNLFPSRAAMGDIPLHDINLYLDQRSQATGVSKLTEEMLGTGGQIENSLPGQLGKWGGRAIAQEIDNNILHLAAASSRMNANFKTSIDNLVSADTPSWNMIRDIAATMRNQGGYPFQSGKKANGEPLWSMGFFLPDPLKNALPADTTMQNFLQYAQPRGDMNPLFAGSIPDINGNLIFSRQTPVEQGQIKTGTPFNPIAFVGVAAAADNSGAALSLQGGGPLYNSAKTDTPWFDDFPGNPLVFMGSQAYNYVTEGFWGAGETQEGVANCMYALVRNPLNATTDPGKVGMIAYTVPAGANTLVVRARLGAVNTTGINNTTVGAVVYGGAVLNSANFTQSYAVGAAIIPCNRKGTPLAAMPALGANALGFCRGKMWGDMFNQKVQGGGSGEDLFSFWTYGCVPFSLPNNFTPGIMVAACAAYYPEYGLPTVT